MRSMFSKFLIRWGPAIALMLLIYIISSMPSMDVPDFGSIDGVIKKISHMIGYAILAQACAWGVNRERQKTFLMSLLIVLFYALFDEYHQSFVPGRHARITDIGFDMVGGFLGLLISPIKVQGILSRIAIIKKLFKKK